MGRHEIVLFGATGFTGRLVAAELARRPGCDWALAGRRPEALEALRASLGVDVPCIVADATDPEALHELARRARVVCTTVGPYARTGLALVEACVEQGAHYCDLAGEPQFVADSVTRFHEAARARGLRIVHACGFDSIPSDLGCQLLQDAAIERFGQPFPRVRLYVRALRGGVSGGTVESLMGAAESSPGALGAAMHDLVGFRYDRADGSFLAPFVMAPTNASIVRRTNELLDWRYGRDFAYDEVSSFRGVSGGLRAAGLTVGTAAMVALIRMRAFRRILRSRLPSPGEGPSPEEQARGRFVLELVGRGSDTLRVSVGADRDPGYACTASMLAESALCLARDPLPEHFGVLTPAAAMGHALRPRLERVGIRFEVSQAGP